MLSTNQYKHDSQVKSLAQLRLELQAYLEIPGFPQRRNYQINFTDNEGKNVQKKQNKLINKQQTQFTRTIEPIERNESGLRLGGPQHNSPHTYLRINFKQSPITQEQQQYAKVKEAFNFLQRICQIVKVSSATLQDGHHKEKQGYGSKPKKAHQTQEEKIKREDDKLGDEEEQRLKALDDERFNDISLRKRSSNFNKQSSYTLQLLNISKLKSKVAPIDTMFDGLSQWASEDQLPASACKSKGKKDRESSFKRLQKQSLKSIAQNLSNLNSQIDSETTLNDQNYSSASITNLFKGDRKLQMKIRQCKQSILNIDSLLTLNEESKQSEDEDSMQSQNRKNSINSSGRDDQESSAFSDALSQKSKSESDQQSIILPPVTLKGLFMNIKRLSNDKVREEEKQSSNSKEKAQLQVSNKELIKSTFKPKRLGKLSSVLLSQKKETPSKSQFMKRKDKQIHQQSSFKQQEQQILQMLPSSFSKNNNSSSDVIQFLAGSFQMDQRQSLQQPSLQNKSGKDMAEQFEQDPDMDTSTLRPEHNPRLKTLLNTQQPVEKNLEFAFDTMDELVNVDDLGGLKEDQENQLPRMRDNRKFTLDEQLKPQIFNDLLLQPKAQSAFIITRR